MTEGDDAMSEGDVQPSVREIRQSEDRFLSSDIFEAGGRTFPRRNGTGTVAEPAREVPVYHSCDVLVVGGGPAGTAAALAAARTGADVVLLERYNHLGGLSTGGVVIWIDRMTDWDGNHVIQGFAREFIERMPREGVAGPPREDWGSRDPAKVGYWSNRTTAFHGIVQWAPTLDPERMKLNAQEMLLEAGVRIVFHAWAARPLVERGAARGDGQAGPVQVGSRAAARRLPHHAHARPAARVPHAARRHLRQFRRPHRPSIGAGTFEPRRRGPDGGFRSSAGVGRPRSHRARR